MGGVTDADLDAKLARISQRMAARAADTRAELDAIGFLPVAQALQRTFGAKLVYLRTPRVEYGDASLMRPGVVGWTQYIRPKARK